MDIKSRFKTYSLDFAKNLSSLNELSKQAETYFVIDENVYRLYEKELPQLPKDRLYLLEAIEEKKTVDAAMDICEKMTSMPSKRNTRLVSLGGGITQDITGFVASNLYRGVYWTFYPSTLLAACDSCIGGKSSLNYKGYKNLLGSFYPPDDIHIYPEFFRTLSEKDYESGLGEVVKFNVIAGKDKFARLETDIEDILNRNYAKLTDYVKTSLEFKKKFIEEDEFDRGVRVLLNYAHTFGHAYETVTHYAVPHGSAVAMGMITANNISFRRGWLDIDLTEKIESVCRKILTHIEIKPELFRIEDLLLAVKKDKKQTGEGIRAVLMKDDGCLQAVQDVEASEIEKAVEHTLKALR